MKFFVSNASGGTPLEWLVYVAYSRWPIEQCFKEEKDELGFDHFEVRGWQSIHRHIALTQVSHLYLNKMREQLIAGEQMEEEAGVFSLPRQRRRSPQVLRRKPYAQSDSRCPGRLVPSLAIGTGRPQTSAGPRRMAHQLHPKPQRHRQDQPSEDHAGEAAKTRHRSGASTDLYRK